MSEDSTITTQETIVVPQDTFNYGFALLRMLMCFEVVSIHFWSGEFSKVLLPFKLLQGVAVPVFFFLSFYLSKDFFLQGNTTKAKKRFFRLCWPQLGWAFIYFVCFFFGEMVYPEIKELWGTVRLQDFFWQVFTGNSPVINASMWFQTDIILITLLFYLCFKFCKKEISIIIILFITLFAIISQYTGLNIYLFDSLRYELCNPLGRIAEMIPYAALGFFCAFSEVFEKLKNHKIVFVLFPIVIIFLLIYSVIDSAPGYGYSNNNNLLLAFFVTGLAYILPLQNASEKIKKVIKFVTRYTLGIYCMHRLIALGIKFFLVKFNVNFDTFILAIAAYIVSFIISFGISKIPCKFFKLLVD